MAYALNRFEGPSSQEDGGPTTFETNTPDLQTGALFPALAAATLFAKPRRRPDIRNACQLPNSGSAKRL